MSMKKLLLFAAACLLLSSISLSQCIIDGSLILPGIYPDTIQNLPHATAGQAYGTDIQVRVFEDTVVSGLTVIVDDITVNSVTGLPPGFSYTCTPANCAFPGNGNGCMWLSGNPTSGQVGTYPLVVNVTLHGHIGIIPVSQGSTINGYKIVIDPAPSPVAAFTAGSTNFCATGSTTFSDNSSNSPTSWQWTFPGGTPSTSTLQNPTVTYMVKGSYDVTLIATNANGSGNLTKTGYIVVDSLPVAQTTPSVNQTICKGSNILLSAVTNVPSASYQWQKNNVDIAGATSQTLQASQQASYRVRVTNNNNSCSKLSKPVAVFTQQPAAPISANGPTTFCAGGSVQLQTSGSVSNTFQWLRKGIVIPGATSPIYNATTWGGYRVRVTDPLGCSNTSGSIYVTVNQRPNVTVSPNPAFFCAGDSVQLVVANPQPINYQWIENGFPTTGGPTLWVSNPGIYHLTATNFVCTNTSGPIQAIINCRSAENENAAGIITNALFSIYPNPVKGDMYIYLSLPGSSPVSIDLFDITGRKAASVTNTTFESGSYELIYNTTALPNGIYIASIKTGSETRSLKLVVDNK